MWPVAATVFMRVATIVVAAAPMAGPDEGRTRLRRHFVLYLVPTACVEKALAYQEFALGLIRQRRLMVRIILFVVI